MDRYLRGKRRVSSLTLLIPVILVLSLVLATPALAGGIGISGTFSGQHFQLVPGESLSTSDIYVVVFNNSDSDMRIKMSSRTPAGVELVLSTADFPLPPGSNQKLEVGIATTPDAVPGEYTLILTAEAYREGEGIMLTGAAQMQAKLTLFGEAGKLRLFTTTPEGEPFPAKVKLYRKTDERNLPCGQSETGKLETRLAPGDYLAEAYFDETMVAEESFSLAADEEKEVILVAQTVSIQGFSAVPNYYTKGRELAFVKIVYTINNLYQPLEDVKASLEVTFKGQAVEKSEFLSLPILNVGKTEGSYNYTPAQGWQDGTYGFKIELYGQGEPCARSSVEEVSTEPAAGGSAPVNWALIGGIVGGVVVIALIVLFLRRRTPLWDEK